MHMKLNKNQENEKEKHLSSSADIFVYIQPYFILILLEVGVSRNDPTDFEEAWFFFFFFFCRMPEKSLSLDTVRRKTECNATSS